MSREFPSVEPPNYLQRLSPELYRRECQRIEARFDEAVRLAEDAFTEELTQLVAHLSERLSGGQEGKPKIFRDTAITNLTEFFQRFGRLTIRSNEELDQLVEEAQEIVRGVQPQQLRENLDLREHVADQLGNVQNALDDLLVDRPSAPPEHSQKAAVIGMDIVITPDGTLRCLYGEDVDLHVLGQLEIRRGSHVEPTENGCWTADLSPVGGPVLGPFPNRSEALNAEREWLQKNWLNSPATPSQSLIRWKGESHALDIQKDP